MKVYFFSVLMMLLCACGFAQQPVLADDLNTGTDTIVQKFELSNDLDPVRFNERLTRIRKDVYRKIRSGDAKEKALRRLDADYYLRSALLNYNRSHDFVDSIKKTTAAQHEYFDSLIWSNADLNNEELYKRSATYREWIGNYLVQMSSTKYQFGAAIISYKGVVLQDSVILKEIQNPFIRDYILYHNAATHLMMTTDSVLARKLYHDFNAEVTNPYYREAILKKYDNFRLLHTPNMPTPDFTYTTVEGKQLTLSSLHGKFVYIDLWATWCGPCKMEIPYLGKLEERYEGKNIAFVSLSVDKQADLGKWRNYVTGNKLTGYQVMADNDLQSEFIQKFDVVSIPRFILIDPGGKLVDADAKRPSDPTLRKQIDQLLGIPAAPFALSPYVRQTDFSGQWQLDTTKTHFGKLPEQFASLALKLTKFVSGALTVTENDTALMIDRINVNETREEMHYSQQFRLDGTSTRVPTSTVSAEEDSIINAPDIPALTLGMARKNLSISVSITETWTLEDGGKTLVVDKQEIIPGWGMFEVKGYYAKK